MMAEVEYISGIKRAVILFDDYTISREALPAIRQMAPEASYVATIRSGTLDYRSKEVSKLFGRKLATLDLNWVERDEFQKFDNWATQAGVVASEHREGYGQLRHIREFILDKYENSQILRDRVAGLADALKTDRSAFRSFVVLMIFRHIGEAHQSDMIAYRVLGYDAQTSMVDFADLWGEVSDEAGTVGSSIFSEFVIANFVDADDLLRIVEEIVGAVSEERRTSKRDDAIFAKCLNFGQLYRLCGGDDAATDAIVSAYDRLRKNAFVSDQPLFWLQVAIAMTAKEDYRRAWEYIEVAYSKVNKDFEPYHIDTKALEVLFRLGAIQGEKFGTKELRGLSHALERCVAMISNDRNRTDVLRALSHSVGFFQVRAAELSQADSVRMMVYLGKASQQLGNLSAEARAYQGTDEVKALVDAAINEIKSVG
jgi:hypothetical protein